MRTWQVLAVAAAAGLASLLLVPMERRAADTPLPPLALRALSLVQPAILTALALAVGAALAPRVGLGAPLIDSALAGRPLGAMLRRQLPAAVISAAVVAAIRLAYQRFVAPALTEGTAAGARAAAFALPLATRLLYGGIVEEVMTRWGLVSLFVWLLARRRDPVPAAAYWLAIALAVALFAAGHLPALFLAAGDPPAPFVAAVLAGNFMPGLVFGWLYWRRGLEAAIVAHAGAHALMALIVAGAGTG
jgi:hypothetical protein